MRLGLCQILLDLTIIRDLLCAMHIARCFTDLVSRHLPHFTDKETEALQSLFKQEEVGLGLEPSPVQTAVSLYYKY